MKLVGWSVPVIEIGNRNPATGAPINFIFLGWVMISRPTPHLADLPLEDPHTHLADLPLRGRCGSVSAAGGRRKIGKIVAAGSGCCGPTWQFRGKSGICTCAPSKLFL